MSGQVSYLDLIIVVVVIAIVVWQLRSARKRALTEYERRQHQNPPV